jgi:predicted PhzF superfamily epimerase YddE/YHI9
LKINNHVAFVLPLDESKGVYHLRWLTPTVEVNLCGHATLATAHVLFYEVNNE